MMQPMHKRKYVPGSVDLRMGRVMQDRNLDRHDYIERLVIDSGMLDQAPFLWIGLIYRYGYKTNLIPEYDKREIDPKDGEIAIAIELDMDILEWADMYNVKLFMEMMMIGALEALIHIGVKYKLPIDLIRQERSQFRAEIPKTIEECKALPKLTMADYPPMRKYFRDDINVCTNCFCAKVTEKARQCLACMQFNDPYLITK